jgi:hypothetical protein
MSVWIDVNDSSISRRIFVFRLYISRDLIIEFETSSSIQSVERILDEAVWTLNWREMFFFISSVNVILLYTEWASVRVDWWLCFSSIIFSIHSSSSRTSISLKEHSMILMLVCRRFLSTDSSVLSSRSHFNQTLRLILNRDFFICVSITT